ncbi:MAG: YggS family pyridoxal phosphate-dependent enzyme [Burkholderiaceae bacterium]|uniref:Pyridoxal phosphate homeostasis protein n=1 Tax=Herminiimonas contaminans TaxID=1111140 RepID=A0ABS0ERP0_9BURK|nr:MULTISPECIES: YggS family pyridoxal phosphate-dependent enzyme [Oxalobacteraceae]MBF8177461.1 YggS family pyridoxal phosphate-dependent enzyme [Herminiimonas contaminans]MBX9800881.1 YggS family pyridoxal phosphate-dependent enzyme [Burkholderiaceae bacterium]
MSVIGQNLQAVRQRITDAANSAQRDVHGVELLAVSKTFGADAVIAAAEAGQGAFGENYLQEALEKIAEVKATRPDLQLEWHFIGPIQSNKTRPIAEHFDWVHSVDRLKIAQRLSEQRPDGLPPLNVCLQVNISGEASKSGVLPEETLAVAQAIAALPRLQLRGLMAIPEATGDAEQQRAPFRQMHALLDQLREQGLKLDTLSMGMSGDMAAAIAEGATIVRIGSAIFGTREYAK